MRNRVASAAAAAALAGTLFAGSAPGQSVPHDEPGASLRVFVVTVDPGPRTASRFGHSAIRIRDAAAGTDDAYSFGRSDLGRPGFMASLLQGRVEAWMAREDPVAMMRGYAESGRTVWVQELSLLPRQRLALREELEDSRGSFRYDFFLDNCTTRVRDALDRALGGQLRSATEERVSPASLRAHAARFIGSDPLVRLIAALTLGNAVDRPISVWNEMFLPSTLRARLREVIVHGREGDVPLVAKEGPWFESQDPGVAEPRSLWPLSLGGGLLLGSTLAFLGAAAPRSRAAGRAFSALGAGWLVLAGLIGLGLVVLWGVSDQIFPRWNENLLPLSPLALPLAVAGWGSWRHERAARGLAVALAGLALVGVLLKPLPAFAQSNAAVLCLAVPVQLGLAWGIWRRTPP